MTDTKKYSLPRDFAEKWVAALRSGEYKQGKGALLDSSDCFCCLGVAGIVGGCSKRALQGYTLLQGSFHNGMHCVAPQILGKNKLVDELTTMNDDGKSFPEIADWIEHNVEFV